MVEQEQQAGAIPVQSLQLLDGSGSLKPGSPWGRLPWFAAGESEGESAAANQQRTKARSETEGSRRAEQELGIGLDAERLGPWR